MTLQLDARQRAMLEEMGIKVWLPQPPAQTAEAAVPPAPRAHLPAPPSGPQALADPAEVPSSPTVPPPALAPAPRSALPAAAPVPAPAAATAAPLLITAPQRLYASEGQSATGGWLVVVETPPHADGRHDGLLDGEAGRLLDQMLRALRLPAGTAPVHAMRLWRASPGQPDTEGALDFEAAFAGAVAPLAPQLVLALGPLAAQRLLGQQAPLGRLRGCVHQAALAGAECAVVASYHPAYLLRNGDCKGRAWVDLCLAAERLERAA
ncbi:uracil-DNA glycosylase family protein [Xenophilus sp. Marseille-Q4582]|uniref:uracil-DNA glycosylase family protein n=1 Tax=Xenophilus sp. Marseille-Q4582 TaxID=2866600 RepID=UPI001CE48C91|nr:uracil-DNA glycosylase family protein [Xenophilus sp. Marseille-Q4582]